MNTIGATERTRLRATMGETLLDSCRILVYTTGAADAYGVSAITYIAGSEINCGYEPTASKEVQRENQVIVTDGKLRLPIVTAVTTSDRILVTRKIGETLTTQPTYEIVGLVQGPTAIVLDLALVTDGTDA
jgi:hypothetical protein